MSVLLECKNLSKKYSNFRALNGLNLEIENSAGGALADSNIIARLSMLSITTFVIAIIAVILGTVVIIIKRFYDNMLKDEGYLTFTLPVSTGQHIVSKAFTSYVWIICSGAVIIASI